MVSAIPSRRPTHNGLRPIHNGLPRWCAEKTLHRGNHARFPISPCPSKFQYVNRPAPRVAFDRLNCPQLFRYFRHLGAHSVVTSSFSDHSTYAQSRSQRPAKVRGAPRSATARVTPWRGGGRVVQERIHLLPNSIMVIMG